MGGDKEGLTAPSFLGALLKRRPGGQKAGNKARGGMAMRRNWLLGCMLMLAGSAAGPALADVKSGVDAWQRGDYKRAVEEWRAPALAGDPDAQFNLAQAYKLGRGVPVDPALAQSWYLKAARQGHLQAADNYGLSLYQDGKKADALPWLEKGASRGEPRTQLVLATLLFNGDGVPRDPARAYALMSRASQQGLKSASENLAQMDGAITNADRERGIQLAQQYAAGQDAQRLAAGDGAGRRLAAIDAPARSGQRAIPPAPIREQAVTVEHAPRDAQGHLVPGEHGRPGARPPAPISATHPAGLAPDPRAAAHRPAPKRAAEASGGRWRVQLGAFRSETSAREQWSRVSGALGDARPSYVHAGAVTRLQAGPYASRVEAQRACKAAHVACDVVAP